MLIIILSFLGFMVAMPVAATLAIMHFAFLSGVWLIVSLICLTILAWKLDHNRDLWYVDFSRNKPR